MGERKRISIKKSNKEYKVLNGLCRDGSVPATQKQIDYIEYLKKDSIKTYDYYYPRDKYFLSRKVATRFILAIQNQEDFNFNRGVNKKRKIIEAWKVTKRIEIQEDPTLGINNEF